jgi:hypothetical protein
MDNTELRERRRIAQHEALHGLLGLKAGAVIEEIRAWPYGETSARFPLNPWTLKYKYARSPDETQTMVTKILAAIISPKVTMPRELLDGSDLELVEQWEHAWSTLPGAISSRELRTDATLYVMDWEKKNRQLIDNVTAALMERRKVWGHSAWLRLVQECRPPEAPRRSAPASSRPAPPRQRALNRSFIRVEHLPWFSPDWRTSRHAGAPLVHQSW